ncbi:MAG: hypothetical protein ACRELB_01105 [Polyangiaceae bacterium]
MIWQSRCDDCLRAYHRRRDFFLGPLTTLAMRLGIAITNAKGTTHRAAVLPLACGDEARQAVVDAVTEFNSALPMDQCDIERHGIRLDRAGTCMAPNQLELQFGANAAGR